MDKKTKALESCSDYTVGWIAPLKIERAAAEALLDERHERPSDFNQRTADYLSYSFGSIRQHKIVIVSLQSSSYGNVSAAPPLEGILYGFPGVRILLLVGIGGGIPRPESYDLRLGDVVVGHSSGSSGGVIQYDLLRAKGRWQQEDESVLNSPPSVLLQAIAMLEAQHERKGSSMPKILQEMKESNPFMFKKRPKNPGYGYQGHENDRLFKSSYEHVQGKDCQSCSQEQEVEREPRGNGNDPVIHYGVIASGNTLFMDSAAREKLSKQLPDNCICYEMEAAGLMNDIPCLVIRGICDYSDSHKNDRWQRYAAATAASFAKELLTFVQPDMVLITQGVSEFVSHQRRYFGRRADAEGTSPDWQSSATYHQEPSLVELAPEKQLSRPLEQVPPVYSSFDIKSDKSYDDTFAGSSNMISESRFSSKITDPASYALSNEGDAESHRVKTMTGATGEDSDLQDTATIYSEVSGADTEMMNSYVSQFVSGVLEALHPATRGRESLHRSSRIEEVLPGLLKDFAVRFGHDSQSQDRRDIVFYTHRHSSKIATRLAQQWRLAATSYVDEPDPKPDLELHKTKQERAMDWVAEAQATAEEPPEAPEIVDDAPETPEQDQEGSLESLDSEYLKLILESMAYKWLLAALRREMVLKLEDSPSMVAIRKAIALPRAPRISAKRSVEIFNLTFHIPWDPTKFVKDQRYREKPEDAIYRAITLTGADQNAQALTTAQYLLQTWPTTGQQILQLVQAIVAEKPHGKVTCSLPEGTSLTAWMEFSEGENSQFLVEASGTSSALQEVGEQLGWISAALRSSPFESVTFCTPKVVDFRRRSTAIPEDILRFDCSIEYTFRPVEEDIIPTNGNCWHNLFRNPVVVEGYPIPLREERDTGLEIPLNAIAALADTRRVDEFSGKLFIKGFATMLYPTKRSGEDVVIWHLTCNKDGEHISYVEVHGSHINVQMSVLEQARHIVGWCSEAELLAGSAKAKYGVGKAQLPRPSDDCVLQNMTISGGKIITGGFNVAIAIKDRPIHVERGGYIPRLEWVHQKFAVFWDEKHKRGWLVNGTTALLHLVRSAWKAKEEGPFKDALENKSDALQEPTKPNMTTSAIEVLKCKHNKQLQIYEDEYEEDGKTTYFRFQDLVGQMYNTVEKMIDHQSSAASRSGMSLKCRARNHIDGWDFTDVISERDCNPAVATLHSMGKGWVHLVNDIGAVVFLGQDFGELIKPISAAGCCKHWAQLPTDSYYLGVCVSDIVQIIQSYGNKDCTEPRKLSASISWPNSEYRFRRCECGSKHDHSDLSQMLQSSEEFKSLPDNEGLAANGAVIFRHNYELTGFSLSQILDRGKRTIKASDGPQRPKDSVVGSSQAQSAAPSSSGGDHLRSCEATPPERTPSSGALNGSSRPSISDEDIHRQSESGIAQGIATEGEAARVEIEEGSTEPSREELPNPERVEVDVGGTPRDTNDGEDAGGEVESGITERQLQEESQTAEVQGNSDASRNTNDGMDNGEKLGRRSRWKRRWRKFTMKLSGKG